MKPVTPNDWDLSLKKISLFGLNANDMGIGSQGNSLSSPSLPKL